MANAPAIDDWLDRLSLVSPDDREAIRTLSAATRRIIEGAIIPDDLAAAISRRSTAWANGSFAVRSSATAEDLATASSAGQQDTYLNVRGTSAILQMVKRCWASLFTERAVTYRMQHGVDHRLVQMGVIVQEMVVPDVAGTLFTADPVTSDRTVACVEASFGLGEALVSGPSIRTATGCATRTQVITRSVGTKVGHRPPLADRWDASPPSTRRSSGSRHSTTRRSPRWFG